MTGKRFSDHLGDKTITTNLVFQVIGQFGGRLLGYVFFLYAARMLGTGEFGAFSFALSVGYLVCTIMDFGLDPLCVKWVAREETNHFFLLASTKVVTILTGLGIICVVSFFFDRRLQIPIMLLGFGFCFFSLLNFIYSYFRGIEKMAWEALLLTGQRVCLLCIGLLLFMSWRSAISASIAFSLSLFLTFFAAFPLLQKYVRKPLKSLLNLRRREIAEVLKEAYPLAMVGFLWVIYYRIDTIMLAGFRSMPEVGIYNGAYKIMEGLILVAGVIMMVTFPRLSRLGMEKGREFYLFFKKLFLALLSLAFLVTVIMYFTAAPLFQLILGEQYSKSIGIFKILLVAVIVIYPGNLVTQALIALDLHKVYMYMALMGALFNICLNFLFIPQYGATGAAWATVFTETSLTAACVIFIYGYYRRWQRG